MIKFSDYLKEAEEKKQIGNRMIFRATRLKGKPGEGKRVVSFYRKPDGTFFRWEGRLGQSGGSITKEYSDKEAMWTEIDALVKIGSDSYKFEEFDK